MEIQQLRYIVSLCRYKNFTRVAETLFVSQSAVSQQIKKIEQELGVCLFSRSTHGMMPTPAGSELCRYAQTVLDAYDQFMDASRHLTEQGENTIKVFALNKLKVVGLPAALMEFHNSHPDIALEFVNQSNDPNENVLSQNNWDVAIIREANCEPYRNSPEYCCEQLMEDPGALLVSKFSKFANRQSVSLDELQGLELLFGNKGGDTYNLIQNICAGINPPIQISKIFTDDYDILVDVIQNSEVGAIGCRSFGKYYGLNVIPLVSPIYNNLILVYPTKKKDFPVIKKLKMFLISHFSSCS